MAAHNPLNSRPASTKSTARKKPSPRAPRGVSLDTAREIALSLPETSESDHWGHPSFRVNKKIFATLWPDERRAMVKLTADQQDDREGSKAFTPVEGYWGLLGATFIDLNSADESTVREAITLAWKNAAPKKLVKATVI